MIKLISCLPALCLSAGALAGTVIYTDSAHPISSPSAGIPVVYDLRPTLPHAFVNFAGVVPAAERALNDAIRATAAALRDLG